MRLTQQHLAGPLAVAVAVGVVVADLAGSAHLPDVGVLDEAARLDTVTHADRRDVDERLDAGGQGDADELRGADDVGPEQLAVGQHVVDQRGGVDDQVDGVGQSLPSLPAPGRDSPRLCRRRAPRGDRPPVTGSAPAGSDRRCRTSRRDVPRGVVILGADQGDDLAVDHVHPFQPLQRQVAAQEAGGAR